jgi:hypothetical protein
MDTKLTMLLALFAIIIALSHLNDDTMARMKKQFIGRRRNRARSRS